MMMTSSAWKMNRSHLDQKLQERRQKQRERRRSGSSAASSNIDNMPVSRLPTPASTRRRRPRPTSSNSGDALLDSVRALEENLQENFTPTRDDFTSVDDDSSVWRSATPFAAGTATPAASSQRRRRARPWSASQPPPSRIPSCRPHEDDDEDKSTATNSSIAEDSVQSQESVFDRLYKQQLKKGRANRRISYTKNEATSTPATSTSQLKPRRNRVAQYHQPPYTSPNLTTPKNYLDDASSTTSSVFERLYRNQPRSETLWTPPPPATSTPRKKRSPIDLTTTPTHEINTYDGEDFGLQETSHLHDPAGSRIPSTTSKRQGKTADAVLSTPERLHRNEPRPEKLWTSPPKTTTPRLPKRRSPIDLTTTSGDEMIEIWKEPPSTIVDKTDDEKHDVAEKTTDSVPSSSPAAHHTPTVSMQDTMNLLDDLLVSLEDSPRTTTTVAVTDYDEEGTWGNRTVTSWLGMATPATSVVGTMATTHDATVGGDDDDEDIIEEILRQDTMLNTFPQAAETAFSTLEDDLKEIAEIGRALSGHDDEDNSELSGLQARTTLDQDMAEIEAIGRTLSGSQGLDEKGVQGLDMSQEKLDREFQEFGQRHSSAPPRSSPQSAPPKATTLDQDMAEIEAIGRALRRSRSTDENNKTPSVVFIHQSMTEDDDLWEGGVEDMPPSSSLDEPLFANAPTPRRRTRPMPSEWNANERVETDPIAFPESQPHRQLFVDTGHTRSNSTPPVATNCSHGSSGFFTLDEPSGGLVLGRDDCFKKKIAVPVSNEPVLTETPLHAEVMAATKIQCRWRVYCDQRTFVQKTLKDLKVSWAGLSASSSKLGFLQQATQNLHLDPSLDQGLQRNDKEIIVTWETRLAESVTMYMVVDCNNYPTFQGWSTHKMSKHCLYAGLLQEITHLKSCTFLAEKSTSLCADKSLVPHLNEKQPAEEVVSEESELLPTVGFVGLESDILSTSNIQSSSLLSLLDDDWGDEEELLVDDEPSLTSTITSFKPTFMDIEVLNKHRAAATIQNWYRLCILQAALSRSAESHHRLNEVLDSISNISHGSSISGEVFSQSRTVRSAKHLLESISSSDQWFEEKDRSELLVDEEIGTVSQQWIKQRAASIAIQNIIRTYIRGLQLYRRNRLARSIQASWRRYICHRNYCNQRVAALRLQRNWKTYSSVKLLNTAVCQIQATWRMHCNCRKYQITRFSIVVVQASARSFICRRRFLASQCIAKAIQSYFRAQPDRDAFLRLRSAIATLQNRHQIILAKARFFREWRGAITLQRVWRGAQAQKCFQWQTFCVVTIQKEFRRFSSAARFSMIKTAVIRIQTGTRRQQALLHYSELKIATTKIQTTWRRWFSMSRFRMILNRVILVQCQARKYLAREERLRRATMLRNRQLNGAVVIQAIARRGIARSHFEYLRVSTIQIQSAFRLGIARKRYTSIRRKTIQLQAVVRANLAEKRFERIRQQLILLQASVRRNQAVAMLLQSRIAAVMVQACWKGALQRRILKVHGDAAENIQRFYRGYANRTFFITRIAHVTKIQCFVRRYISQRMLTSAIFSVTSIQSFWRGFAARLHYSKKRVAIVMLQSAYRGRQQRVAYGSARRAGLILQTFARASLAKNYLAAKRITRSVVSIQSAWRGSTARSCYSQKRAAVIMMQCTYRGYQQRVAYGSARRAGLILQTFARASLAKKYLAAKRISRSAVSIQSAWRGSTARSYYSQKRTAVIMMQCAYRGYQQRVAYGSARRAGLILQTFARASLAIRYLAAKRISRSAVSIQSAWRGSTARSYYSQKRTAVIMMQCAYRGYQQRVAYGSARRAGLILQTFARASLATKYLAAKRISRSVVSIQSAWRGSTARSYYSQKRTAVIMMQCAYRGYQQRVAYGSARRAGLILQTFARASLAKRYLAAKRISRSAVSIQSAWRGSTARSYYSQKRAAVIMMQCAYRGYQQRVAYGSARRAGLILQTFARTVRARNYLELLKSSREHHRQTSTLLIQSYWRCRVARRIYTRTRSACIIVQAFARIVQARRTMLGLKATGQIRLRAAVLLQRYARGEMARRKLALSVAKAVMLQSKWRGYRVCKTFQLLRMNRTATIIQAHIRSFLIKTHSRRLGVAAVVIQSQIRRASARQRFSECGVASVAIQALFRGASLRSTIRKHKLAAIMIQRTARGLGARRALETKLLLRIIHEETRQTNAAKRIQRFMRIHQSCKLSKLYFKARRVRAAQTITRAIRALLLRKVSVVNIQKHVRSFVQKRKYVGIVASCILIQANLRRWQAQKEYRTRKRSVVKIQAYWRASLAAHSYGTFCSSSILIQGATRGWLARLRFMQQIRAVLIIQRTWNLWIARKHFEDSLQSLRTRSAKIIQSNVLAWARLRRDRRLVFSSSASQIQLTWRKYLMCKHREVLRQDSARLMQKTTREWLRLRHETAKIAAALLIQRSWRYSAQKEYLRSSAALSIQYIWRYHRSRMIYSEQRNRIQSVRQIQKSARLWLSKRQQTVILRNRMATRVQIAWRSFVSSRRCMLKDEHIYRIRNVERIQVQVRCWLQHHRRVRSTITIQRLLRQWQSRRILRHYNAATRIQQSWRKVVTRRLFLRMKAASINVQSYARMLRAKSKYRFLHMRKTERSRCLHDAACKIQMCFWLWKMREAALEMKSSAVILHRCMRGQLVRSAARYALSHMTTSMRSAPVSPIARVSSRNGLALECSAWNNAVEYAHTVAAIVIQAAARRMLVRLRLYDDRGISFSMSQLALLGDVDSSWETSDDGDSDCSTWNLDPTIYGYSQGSERIKIETAGGGFGFRRIDTDAKEMKRVARAALAKMELSSIRQQQQQFQFAVEIIQRFARHRLAMGSFCVLVSARREDWAARAIQYFTRRVLLAKRLKFHRLRQEAAVVVQCIVRQYFAKRLLKHFQGRVRRCHTSALRIQSLFRAWIYRRLFVTMLKAAVNIQRIVRGSRSRAFSYANLVNWRRELADRNTTILEAYVLDLERASRDAVNRMGGDGQSQVSGVPCINRFASMLRSEVQALTHPNVATLPGYVEEVIRANDLPAEMPQSPGSPRHAASTRQTTPTRSNKTSLTAGLQAEERQSMGNSPRPSGAAMELSLSDILKQGRSLTRISSLRLPQLVNDVPSPKMESASTKGTTTAPLFAKIAKKPEVEEQASEKKETSSEGKQQDEWDWANAW